jgi:hypothetical protein
MLTGHVTLQLARPLYSLLPVHDDGALPLQVIRVANTTVDRVSDLAEFIPCNRAHTLTLTAKATADEEKQRHTGGVRAHTAIT